MTGLGSDPFQRINTSQTQRNFAWRDYGLRVGIWRVFQMLDDLKLPATILLNSLVCENYPEVIERIKRRGDEVCAHGRTNAESVAALWEHDEARIIAETTETITRYLGGHPICWSKLGTRTAWPGPLTTSRYGCGPGRDRYRASNAGIASIHHEIGAGHKRRLVARQEQGAICDLVRLSETAEGMQRNESLTCDIHIAESEHQPICLDCSGRKCIHPNTVFRMIERY
jgi:Polysaccharide deacetylase